MGRYDTRFLAAVQELVGCAKVTMLSTFLIFMLCGVVFSDSAAAQETGRTVPSEKVQRKFTLKMDYPTTAEAFYRIVERTETERVYRDSVKKKYSREVVYYISQRAQNEALFENSFSLMSNVDSLVYTFTENGKTVTYNSQSSTGSKVNGNSPDFIASVGLLNRPYSLVIDNATYGIRAVGGANDGSADVNWLKNYVLEDKEALDTGQKWLWLDAVSAKQCVHVGNLSRNLLIGKMQVAEDSLWKIQTPLRIDFINFDAGLDVKIASYQRGGNLIIEGKSDVLKPVPNEKARLHGVPDLCDIVNGTGFSSIRLFLNTRGRLSKMESESKTTVKVKYNLEEFLQTTNQSITCTLMSRQNW